MTVSLNTQGIFYRLYELSEKLFDKIFVPEERTMSGHESIIKIDVPNENGKIIYPIKELCTNSIMVFNGDSLVDPKDATNLSGPHLREATHRDYHHVWTPEDGHKSYTTNVYPTWSRHNIPDGIKEIRIQQTVCKPVVVEHINSPQIEGDTVVVEKPGVAEYIEHIKSPLQQAKELCQNFYKAIDGLGTNNELFESTIEGINAGNISEVINEWNKTYGKEYGETFIESFLDDANTKQRQIYGNQLIQALYERVTGDNNQDFEDKLTEFQKLNEANFFPDKKKMAELFNSLATSKDN